MDGPAARGHTLIELLCLLAVAAALAAWAVPALRDLRLNSARTVAVNGFVQAVHLARSEALKRNGVVSLCPSRDGRRCAYAGPGAASVVAEPLAARAQYWARAPLGAR